MGLRDKSERVKNNLPKKQRGEGSLDLENKLPHWELDGSCMIPAGGESKSGFKNHIATFFLLSRFCLKEEEVTVKAAYCLSTPCFQVFY